MVETAAGHRVLLAPHEAAADFIAATYSFDEVRLEPFAVTGEGRWQVRSTSLHLDLDVGRTTALGVLLALVPRRLAESPAWCTVTDVVARVLVRGVRTRDLPAEPVAERARQRLGHRMGIPEIARAMTSRWISEVPSKIV